MKIVITGGAGFIGLKLAKELIFQGHEVSAIDPLTPQIHGELPALILPEGLELVRADVRDIDTLVKHFEDADVIYHLAAETGTGQSMYKFAQYVSVNDLGTAHILEALARCTSRPRKIILGSSRSVYGEGAYQGNDGTLIQPDPRSSEHFLSQQWEIQDKNGDILTPIATPENLPYCPGSVYAATKASQEMLLQAASLGVNAKTCIFRFQNVYGDGQSLQNPYTGIISIFFNRARQGLKIPLYEDGNPTRDFIHIDDVVAALITASELEYEHGVTINLGSGKPTSISELAAMMIDISGLNVPIQVTGQYRLGDIRHNWADLSKAKSLLGFETKVTMREGLARFIEWARSQPVYEDRSAQAEAELRSKGLSN
jgi:dTDP-L-rhamnose 4-epimerase